MRISSNLNKMILMLSAWLKIISKSSWEYARDKLSSQNHPTQMERVGAAIEI
jgi:hypothetical protein